MSTAKYHAFGTKFQIKDTTWKTVAHVADISGPGFSADTEDVTTHDSTDAWNEFLKGTKDAGEITFELIWDPADTDSQKAVLDAVSTDPDDDPEEIRVVFPSATPTTWEFKGFITGFEAAAPVKGRLSANVTVKLTGKPNFSPTV